MNEVVISGRIEEFPIENIIQVLNQDKKDGLLNLEFKNKKAELYFNNGDIVFVSTTGFNNEDTIENYLLYRHRMKKRDVKEIKEFGMQYGYTFEQSLVAGKYIEKEEAYMIVNAYFEDLLCSILVFKSGTYKFELVNKIKKIDTIRISSNYILMEAGRRLDTKKNLIKTLGKSQSVFVINDKKKLFKDKFNKVYVENNDPIVSDYKIDTTDLSDVNAVGAGFGDDFSFKQTQKDDIKTKILRDVIEAINGIHNVKEVVRYSGWGEFRAWEVLSNLYMGNYLKKIGEKEESTKIEDEILYSTKDRAKFAFAGTLLLSATFLLFLLKIFNIGSVFLDLFSFESEKVVYNRLVTRSLHKFYKEKVDNGKKIYYIINKKAPINMKVLKNNYFISLKEYNKAGKH